MSKLPCLTSSIISYRILQERNQKEASLTMVKDDFNTQNKVQEKADQEFKSEMLKRSVAIR